MTDGNKIHFKPTLESQLIRKQEQAIGKRHCDTNDNNKIKMGIRINSTTINRSHLLKGFRLD